MNINKNTILPPLPPADGFNKTNTTSTKKQLPPLELSSLQNVTEQPSGNKLDLMDQGKFKGVTSLVKTTDTSKQSRAARKSFTGTVDHLATPRITDAIKAAPTVNLDKVTLAPIKKDNNFLNTIGQRTSMTSLPGSFSSTTPNTEVVTSDRSTDS